MKIELYNPASKNRCILDVKEVYVTIALDKHYVITNSIPASILLHACPALTNPEVKKGITKFEVKENYGIIISDSDKTL